MPHHDATPVSAARRRRCAPRCEPDHDDRGRAGRRRRRRVRGDAPRRPGSGPSRRCWRSGRRRRTRSRIMRTLGRARPRRATTRRSPSSSTPRPAGCAVDDREAWKVGEPGARRLPLRGRHGDRGADRPRVGVPAVPSRAVADRPGGRVDGRRAVGVHASTRGRSRTARTWCSRSTGRSRRTAPPSSRARSATTPHLDVVGLWENPSPGDETYRVDVLDVEDDDPGGVPPVARPRSHRRPVPLAAQPRRCSPTSASPSPSTRNPRRA